MEHFTEAQKSIKYHYIPLKDPSPAIDLTLAEEGFAVEEPTTISRLFKQAVETFPNHPALRYKTDNFWEELTYSQYYNKCLETARAYIEVSTSYLLPCFLSHHFNFDLDIHMPYTLLLLDLLVPPPSPRDWP